MSLERPVAMSLSTLTMLSRSGSATLAASFSNITEPNQGADLDSEVASNCAQEANELGSAGGAEAGSNTY